MTTHKNLTVCRLTHSQHLRTCGYWFTVQENFMAHTAFATLAGLLQWAMERGLEVPDVLPREGEHGDMSDERHAFCRIIGEYRSAMDWDENAFDDMKPFRETRTLSNGDWVVAKITKDEDGIRTVHTLNPNVRSRHVFDYTESRRAMS